MKHLPAVGIVGSGLALPERVVTNDDLAGQVDTNDEWIRTRTGIRTRHVLSEGCDTGDLATLAAQRALQAAGVEPAEVDAVVAGTVSGDMAFPGVANLVQHRLGLRQIPAYDVAAACAGFVYALHQGAMPIQTGRARTVLVIGVDAMSKLLDWTDRNTCVLFGDGAGAVVLREVPAGYGLLGLNLGSDGAGGDLLKVVPPEADPTGRPVIQMNGREVYKFAVRVQAHACEAALAEAGVSHEDIDWLVPHQANIRIIESAARWLGVPRERVYVNVDRYGNTSAASIPIALAEATAQGLFQRGDHVVLVGFGGGLSWGAAVLRWY